MSGGELPMGWAEVPVAALAAPNEQPVLTGPFGSKLKTDDFRDEGTAVVTIGCLTESGMDGTRANRIDSSKASEFGRYLLREGDILFSRMASVGRASIVPAEFDGSIFNYHLMRLRLHPDLYLPWLFVHYVRGAPEVRQYLDEVNHGATRDGINTEQLVAMPVKVPPLPEQRRIVAKLDDLRARSRKAREALDEVPALLDKLKQSVLAAAFRGDLTAEWRAAHPDVEPASVLLERIRVERRRRWEEANPKKRYVEPEPVDAEGLPELPEGWCWASLEELTPSDAPIVYGIIQPGPHVPDGVPFVRPADIKGGKVSLSQLPRTSPEIAEDYRRAALLPGDVVFSIVGTIGKWIIAGEELRGANITQSSVRLRPVVPLTPLFFAQALASPVLTQQIGKLLFGNAVQRLNVEHVRKLVVPVPPTAEWSVIEAKLSAALDVVHRLHEASGATTSQLSSLDQSLLAKAFRGELVPQDPTDEPADVLLARIKSEADPTEPKRGRGRPPKQANR